MLLFKDSTGLWKALKGHAIKNKDKFTNFPNEWVHGMFLLNQVASQETHLVEMLRERETSQSKKVLIVISAWILILLTYLFLCIPLALLTLTGNRKVLGRILRWSLRVPPLVYMLPIILLSVSRTYEYNEAWLPWLLCCRARGKISKVGLA